MARLTYEQFTEKLDRWWRLMPEEAWRAVSRAAVLVSNEVQRGHLSGPKMPRGVGGETDATLARQSGRLVRSIFHSVKRPSQMKRGEKISARIGTNVVYGRAHEYGYEPRGLPARPFLRPSLAKEQPRALRLIMESMTKSYEKAGRGL